jgi:hypothetical protein
VESSFLIDIWIFFRRLFEISINIDLTHISFNYIIGRSNGQNVATHLALAIIDDGLVNVMVMGWEYTYSFKYVKLLETNLLHFSNYKSYGLG